MRWTLDDYQSVELEGRLVIDPQRWVLSLPVQEAISYDQVVHLGSHEALERVHGCAYRRLIRDDVEVSDTTVASLRRNQDDVREVASGYECGIVLQGTNDYREGDRIEAYEKVEIARKL